MCAVVAGRQREQKPDRDQGRDGQPSRGRREGDQPRGTVCMTCGAKHRTEEHGKAGRSSGTQLANYAYAFPALELDREAGASMTLCEEARGHIVIVCGATASMGRVLAIDD